MSENLKDSQSNNQDGLNELNEKSEFSTNFEVENANQTDENIDFQQDLDCHSTLSCKEKFVEDVQIELEKQKFYDIDLALKILDKKIQKQINTGKSEELAVSSLGGARYCANTIINEQCAKSKGEILLNDIIFFGLAMTLCVAGTFALAFMSALTGVCGFIFAVKAWTDPIFATFGQKFGAFSLAIIAILLFALGAYLTYKLTLKIIAGTKKHLTSRKYSLSRL